MNEEKRYNEEISTMPNDDRTFHARELPMSWRNGWNHYEPLTLSAYSRPRASGPVLYLQSAAGLWQLSERSARELHHALSDFLDHS